MRLRGYRQAVSSDPTENHANEHGGYDLEERFAHLLRPHPLRCIESPCEVQNQDARLRPTSLSGLVETADIHRP